MKYRSGISIAQTEALTILRGVELAIYLGIRPFEVELDSTSVVDIIRSRLVVLSAVGLFTDSGTVCFVPRTADVVVHGLH
ncbi:hypothetical protein ACOSQ4_011524 [Xanthoceras sorbifolium]